MITTPVNVLTRWTQPAARDRAWCLRELADALDAGLADAPALAQLRASAPNPAIARQLSVAHGATATGAMMTSALKQARVLDAFGAALMEKAGAQPSGRSAAALLRPLADEYAEDGMHQRLDRIPLRLPWFTMLVLVWVLATVTFYVLPSYASFYNSVGVEMPTVTRRLHDFSRIAVWAVAAAFLVLAGVQWLRRAGTPAALALAVDRTVMRISPRRAARRTRSCALMLRGAALALDSGLPLPQALAVAFLRIDEPLLRQRIESAIGADSGDARGSEAPHQPGEKAWIAAYADAMRLPPSVPRVLRDGVGPAAQAAVLRAAAVRFDEDAADLTLARGELMAVAARILVGAIVLLLLFAVYSPLFLMGGML